MLIWTNDILKIIWYILITAQKPHIFFKDTRFEFIKCRTTMIVNKRIDLLRFEMNIGYHVEKILVLSQTSILLSDNFTKYKIFACAGCFRLLYCDHRCVLRKWWSIVLCITLSPFVRKRGGCYLSLMLVQMLQNKYQFMNNNISNGDDNYLICWAYLLTWFWTP